MISTNYGPLGLKDTIDPDDARKAALVERSWAAIVHPNQEASKAEDAQFKHDMTTIELKIRINQLRVVAGLCAYVLVFIKELPFCRPNLRFAMRITDEWDRIFREEYDIPTATDRKKIKLLRMLFDLFAVESAVVEKFFACMESSVEFEDMRPNDDGTLKEWDITQLADVVHNFCSGTSIWRTSSTPGPTTLTTSQHARPSPFTSRPFSRRCTATPSICGVCARAQRPFSPLGVCRWNQRGDPTVQPAQQGAAPGAPGLQFKQIIAEGLTRSDCSELGGQLSARRQLRNKMSHALVDSAAGSAARARPGETETKRFERIVSTNASLRQVHLPNTKQPVELSPAAVAGSHLPTLDEVLNSGVPQNLLDYALQGFSESVSNLGLDHNLAMIGMNSKARWEYEGEELGITLVRSDWDFGWARFKPPVKGKAQPVTTDLPDAVGPRAAPQGRAALLPRDGNAHRRRRTGKERVDARGAANHGRVQQQRSLFDAKGQECDGRNLPRCHRESRRRKRSEQPSSGSKAPRRRFQSHQVASQRLQSDRRPATGKAGGSGGDQSRLHVRPRPARSFGKIHQTPAPESAHRVWSSTRQRLPAATRSPKRQLRASDVRATTAVCHVASD